MVVMKGLAITAGSKPRRLASSGNVQPTNLAMITVTHSVRHTALLTSKLMLLLPISIRSTSKIFTKHTTDKAMPHRMAVRNSFHMTLKISPSFSSSRLKARMTVTEDWEPQLPPVSISMGIKAVRAGSRLRASSKEVMIMPVKVADTISSISQGIRCLNRSTGVLFR